MKNALITVEYYNPVDLKDCFVTAYYLDKDGLSELIGLGQNPHSCRSLCSASFRETVVVVKKAFDIHLFSNPCNAVVSQKHSCHFSGPQFYHL